MCPPLPFPQAVWGHAPMRTVAQSAGRTLLPQWMAFPGSPQGCSWDWPGAVPSRAGTGFSWQARDPLEKENTFPVAHRSAPLGCELWPVHVASLGFWNVRGAGGHAATHSWPHTAGQSEAALRKAQGCRDVNRRRLALSLIHVGKHMV